MGRGVHASAYQHSLPEAHALDALETTLNILTAVREAAPRDGIPDLASDRWRWAGRVGVRNAAAALLLLHGELVRSLALSDEFEHRVPPKALHSRRRVDGASERRVLRDEGQREQLPSPRRLAVKMTAVRFVPCVSLGTC